MNTFWFVLATLAIAICIVWLTIAFFAVGFEWLIGKILDKTD